MSPSDSSSFASEKISSCFFAFGFNASKDLFGEVFTGLGVLESGFNIGSGCFVNDPAEKVLNPMESF